MGSEVENSVGKKIGSPKKRCEKNSPFLVSSLLWKHLYGDTKYSVVPEQSFSIVLGITLSSARLLECLCTIVFSHKVNKAFCAKPE